MPFDLLLRHATVVDGSGAPRYRADLGIRGDSIAAIGALGDTEAARVHDVSGAVVAPGFIDIHTHSDVSMLDDPLGESKAYQGVTTEVAGNCGFSPFPGGAVEAAELQRAIGSMFLSPTAWTWTTLAGWAETVEAQGVSLNIAPLLGHAALRVAAGANADRPATADELGLMERMVAEAMDQGAFGLSTGLTLPPSSYGTPEELVALARVAARSPGAFYTTHARVWAGWHIRAVEEAIEVGRHAGLPVQYSNIAIIDPREHGHADAVLQTVEQAVREGLDLSYDLYPYTAAEPNLSQLLPEWVQAGGVPAMLARLRSPVERRRALAALAEGWYGGLPWEWDKLALSYVRSERNRDLVGRSFTEIAALRRADPAVALLDLIDEEDDYAFAIMHNRVEEDVRAFLRHPRAMLGSDGNAISPTGHFAGTKPHPRFYGTYPRVLGHYVRETALLSVEEAVYKMTGFPAERLGLRRRGRIAEGRAADLVVFDPATVLDRATFAEPQRYPDGIRHVIVNGELIIEDGRHTGRRPGRVLRRGES